MKYNFEKAVKVVTIITGAIVVLGLISAWIL